MSEIRDNEPEILDNELSMTGKVANGPIQTAENGLVHLQINASQTQPPFHCVCTDKTAANAMKFLHTGDEVTIEGELFHLDFPNVKGTSLVVFARHISYGRKVRTTPKISGD